LKGLVKKSTGSWYQIITSTHTQIACRLKGNFRLDAAKNSNPCAVGDWVEYELEPNQSTGIINLVYPRQNQIARTDPHKKAFQQIIASNVSQAILFTSLKQPRVPLGFLDRFSIVAEMYHIPLIIAFNKSDIYGEKEKLKYEEAYSIYTSLGYQVFLISMHEPTLPVAFTNIIQNKTTLVSGHSGVGKSAFINKLCKSLSLETKAVSHYNEKGQHTTTFAEMHLLDMGGYIIDTPGVKEFGIPNIELAELSHYFVEMRRLLSGCKYNNCLHINEPDCAVQDAFENNEIHPLRYGSYLSIVAELESGLKFWQKK
jgi:ribosome biogenesis GTPase